MQSTTFRLDAVALFCALALSTVSWAENNTDYIFNGPTQTTNFGGALYIPMSSPGTNNSLQILNGGSVTNAGGALGLNAGDNFNYAIVSSNGSLWYNSGAYSIGSGGSHNFLLVTNSGFVRMDGDVYVGSTGSVSNRVIVTDAGSVLSVGGRLHAGYAGTAATLMITNEGTVQALQTWVGGFPGSPNHIVLVTGPGSVFSNSFDLSIGAYAGSGGNTITVNNGGLIRDAQGVIGSASGGGNNLALVTGGGVWSNTDYLAVGYSGETNQLIVSDGGRVFGQNAVNVGGYVGGFNSMLVTGSTSVVRSGGGFSVGVNGQRNQATIAGAAQLIAANTYVGSSDGNASNNVLTITGTGSVLTNTDSTYVGYAGPSNRMVIAAGGRVETLGYGYVGYFLRTNINWLGNNNVAEVTGADSVWNVAGELRVGQEGSGNQLLIANGGRANVGSHFYVGYDGSQGGTNNSAVITGADSLLNATGVIGVGYGHQHSSLTVTGAGARATSPVYFGVGIYAPNNQAFILNGGQVSSPVTYVGGVGDLRGSNSVLTISGTDAVMSNTSQTIVGYVARSNRMVIANGGRVETIGIGYLGYFYRTNVSWFGEDNVAEVTGSGSVWNTTSELRVGQEGNRNQLLITSGGRVNAGTSLYVGYDGSQGGTNNSVVVTGSGSLLNAASVLGVGYGQQYNTLTVTGTGARATAGAYFGVGIYAPNNQAFILNGGQVAAPITYVGGVGDFRSSNSVLTISGSGAVMSNTSETIVGYVGSSNRMVIANGGRVETLGVGWLGYYYQPVHPWLGNNNSVEVTGSNSLWNVGGDLRVGREGYGNQLVISDGGRVNAAGAIIVGQNTGTASNNTIVITGPGSILHGNTFISVGNNGVYSGGDNSHLLVTDRGTLEVNSLVGGTSTSAGSISNRGGVYQFTSPTPFVTLYGPGTVSMTNATVSYRGVVGADINNTEVAKISKQGNNSFQLDNSTNANPVSYKFDSVANTGNPSNYQRLALLNNARWVSAFLTNGPGGAIQGGAGDVVEVTRNFIIERPTNPSAEFDLASSTVLFSGGVGHTNAITGDDLGNNGSVGFADGFTAVNFSYGKLSLGSSSDTLCFTSGDGSVSNALYVNWLDLGTTNLVANLHAPSSITIYYFNGNPNNAYLGNSVFQLTDCDGVTVGGLLMPAVPEPSTLLLLALAACAVLRRRT